MSRRPLISGLPAVAGLVFLVAPAPAEVPVAAFNTTRVSHLPLPADVRDLSADGDLVFISRQGLGVTIVDVSTPTAPQVLTTWVHPGVALDPTDTRVLNGVLWVGNQSNDTYCMIGLDITDPGAPGIIAELGPPTFPRRVHNFCADGTHLYLAAIGVPQANYILDVSTPTAPTVSSVIDVGVHDNTVVDDTLTIAGAWDATYRYDVTDPELPVRIARFTSSTPDTLRFNHNAWPIGHSGYVAIAEEVWVDADQPEVYRQGALRIVDFRDPQAPASVRLWRSDLARENQFVTVHNVYVVEPFLYVGCFQEGVKILDVSDPTDPVEVGFYDTYPDPPSELFQGCYGLCALQGPDRIFMTDRTTGFFHVAFNGARRSTLEGSVLDASTLDPIPGARVRSLTADRTVLAGIDGSYELKTGAATHVVRVEAGGYIPVTEAVVLFGLGTLTHPFLLTPTSVGVEGADDADRGPALAVSSVASRDTAVRLDIVIPPALAGRDLELAIFDARGHRVRVLLEELAATGTHCANWDTTTDAGRPVPPGLYLARLRVGRETRVRKLTLVP